MLTVFFSYSHKDESVRDELEVHLSMLKRQCVIEAWHDRRITPGDEFNSVISSNLEKADIILLLVSPYFLASNYCYDIEMNRAIERHEANDAHVIPIIANPCDWKDTPFAKLAALPKDGKPISKYPNQHDAFLEIVQAIKGIAQNTGATIKHPSVIVPQKTAPRIAEERRSSNLRIKKEFTDHEIDTFLEDSYEYIANFFEGSLTELQARNPGITGKFRRINANHFTAAIYRNGKSVGQCGIRLGGGHGVRQIVYSNDPVSTNSWNESFSVEGDGHKMFLKSAGYSRMSSQGNKQLTQQGAAEIFWAILIEPLQR